MLDLVDCLSAGSADNKAHKRNALEIVIEEESFMVVAASDKIKDDWIAAIGRYVVIYMYSVSCHRIVSVWYS